MRRLALGAIALSAVLVALAGCIPVMIGAAAGGTALVATDRRTTGTQVDDEGVELKILNQTNAEYGDRIHLNVTSYNGIVLLTGEVPDGAAKTRIALIAKSTEKVRSVQDELVVAPNAEIGPRTNDSYITSKVKARFIEAGKFPPNAVKVVTERGVVYLMGIVYRSEGATAGDIASTTDGVVRVVKVFEYRT